MSYQTNNNVECTTINTEKYSKIVTEIKKFIDAKKKKSATVKGNVEKIDLSNNILTVRLQSINQSTLSRGSLVLVIDSSDRRKGSQGNIIDTYNSIVRIEIKTDPSIFENKEVIIDSNKINVILKRLEDIVNKIHEGKISSESARILDFIIGENKPHYNEERVSFISKRLNKDQKEAITKSVEADDFHLIIGPPGTGKTFVIEELVKQFSKRNKKLLITAWTNLAVDNIIKRLDIKEIQKIVRIGPISEIDPKVRKYHIDEKMKKHKDWKEVEEHYKIIDNLFKALPEVKDKINQTQDTIDQIKNELEVFHKGLNDYGKEKEKYQELLSTPINNENLIGASSINNEMAMLDQKSESCLSLSNDILEMNEIETKIPQIDYIRQLKRKIKKMKFSILGKKISSFFSTRNNEELKKLKLMYQKNKKHLDKILGLQRQYKDLKILCTSEFNAIYKDENGEPDKDALNSEFEIYNILEKKYLPAIKKQEAINTKRKISEINQDVYKIYLESLKRKIDLLKVMIRNKIIERDIEVNRENVLKGRRKDIFSSIELYKRHVDKLKKDIISDIINKADLIAATAVSSDHYFLADVKFDTMIMDEASQVASFMSLLPLLKCKKFILVGDDKQLQPIEEKEISKELNLSIFNRLLDIYPRKRYPRASTLLTIQYRMNKTIAQIPSEIFYEGKLKTSETVAKRMLNIKDSKHQFLNPKMPSVFIDTSKAEYYEDEVGSGCSNTKEAKYVAYIISLFIKKGIKPKEIGIVTPYVKQKLLIKEFLADTKIKDVDVDTVHKFQGREKDIIIMSFARSKKYSFPQYKLKFVADEYLVNVSITRARKKRILVGNSKTLCQSKLLDKIFNKIGEKNTITLFSKTKTPQIP
ncbi:MAG: AAA family ATPase [Nanoarchaeota archaeon]|nr:AAA family ATPase [Nanoarchaeota archaeon]